jgi:hypothetical protein
MDIIIGMPFVYLFGLPIVLVMWVEDRFLSDKIGLGMKCAGDGVSLRRGFRVEPYGEEFQPTHLRSGGVKTTSGQILQR